MEKRSKILILVIAIVLVVGSIGVYYGYQYYMNQKFDESVKLYNLNLNKSTEYENLVLNDKTVSYNPQDWETHENANIELWNKAMDYRKKAINNTEDMIKYSPNSDYKRYSELLLKMNKAKLQEMEIVLEIFKLYTYTGLTDQTKANQLQAQRNDLYTKMQNWSDEIDQITVLNPDLSKRINNLINETKTSRT